MCEYKPDCERTCHCQHMHCCACAACGSSSHAYQWIPMVRLQCSMPNPASSLASLQTTNGEVRARMGEIAHQRSDTIILTNGSPRLEDPAEIIQVRACSAQHGAALCVVRGLRYIIPLVPVLPAASKAQEARSAPPPLLQCCAVLSLAASLLTNVLLSTTPCPHRISSLAGQTSCLSRMLPMCMASSRTRYGHHSGLSTSCTLRSGGGTGVHGRYIAPHPIMPPGTMATQQTGLLMLLRCPCRPT